jgi:ArsR family transcriptional regulator
MDAVLFNKIAKALADPQRFALLRRITQAPEVGCVVLVEEFPITQATISHHLKELTEAKLIRGRKEGKCMHFQADRETFRAYLHALATQLDKATEIRQRPKRGPRAAARGARSAPAQPAQPAAPPAPPA